MIHLEADMRGVANVMGIFTSIIEDFSKTKNLETLTGLGAEFAIQSFNELIDQMAPAREAELSHMYDWGELGQESGRLWNVIVGGTATNKIVTWDYQQSKNEVPVGTADGDTRKGGHIFRWKAQIVENGTRVKIEPVNGEWLAIPTAEAPSGAGRKSKNGTMWFTKGTVSPPINRVAQGSFTQAWLTHFGSAAIRIVEETVAKEVDQHLESFNVTIAQLPKPKVSLRPTKSLAQIAADVGEKIGRRKNGTFMKKQETIEQALRLQRIGDNLSG